MPAPAPLLEQAEELKGGPLTEAEVLRIRDNAVCVTVPGDVAAAVEAERGYRDLDPADCWEQWLALRAERDGAGE
jgi:hypothetical protein